MQRKIIEKNRTKYMVGSFLILIAITYLIFNMFDAWTKYKEGKKRLEASVSSFQELSEQYSDLQKRKAFEESSTGFETQIRSKFDMNKPDEHVIFIIDEETEAPIKEEKGIKKMMDTFKNFFN